MDTKTTETKKRGKTNGYSSAKLHAKRDQKRLEAEQRQAKYDKLSVNQKIVQAVKRRGLSKREVTRLNKLKLAA